MDQLFRQSGLFRTKWDELRGAETYGEKTIATAIWRAYGTWTPSPGHGQSTQEVTT